MSASTRGCGRMWAALSTLVSHSAALLALCSHRSRSFGSPVMAERGRISLGRPPSSAPNAARTSASPSPLPVPAAPAAVPLAITPGAAVPPHQTRAKVCRGLRCRRQSSRRVRAARAAGGCATHNTRRSTPAPGLRCGPRDQSQLQQLPPVAPCSPQQTSARAAVALMLTPRLVRGMEGEMRKRLSSGSWMP